MKLRQSETLGVFDDHDGGFRHVDADFDYGSGHQQFDFAVFETFHHGVFFLFFHLAVYQADFVAESLLQNFETVFGSRQIDFFRLFDQRADPVNPFVVFRFAFDGGNDFVDFGKRHYSGVNRFAPFGKLVDFGIFHVAEGGQNQCPRDRGGRHHQNVGAAAFVRKV